MKANLDKYVVGHLTRTDDDCVFVVDGAERCQPAGSKVLMANGTWKSIENVKVGDEVISPQEDGSSNFAKVIKTAEWDCDEIYDVLDENKNRLYSCSYNHRIPLVKNGKIVNLPAGMIERGTSFVWKDGEFEKIKVHPRKTRRKEKVYGLEVDSPSRWYVTDNDCVTHNSGKSTLGLQIARYCDHNFDLSRVCMDPDEFREAIERAEPGSAIVYDEAYTGLASRRALSAVNHIITSQMMTMGQKNLVVIIILPTYYMLDKYVALFRARGLFHVYRKGTTKGFFMYFNQGRKQQLYLKNQKFMSYKGVRSNFIGRFYKQYCVDEVEYRKKKRRALEKSWIDKKESGFLEQRNALMYMIWREFGKTRREISTLCNIYGVEIGERTVGEIMEHLYPTLEPYAAKKKMDLLVELKKKQELKGKIEKQRQRLIEKLEKEGIEDKKDGKTDHFGADSEGTYPFNRVSEPALLNKIESFKPNETKNDKNA